MFTTDKLLTRKEWLAWMKSFADHVALKEYCKLNYSDWKILAKPVGEHICVQLKEGAVSGSPMMFVATGGHNPVPLWVKDNSLGDFLFDNMFTEEERKMAYNESTNILNDVSVNGYYDGYLTTSTKADQTSNYSTNTTWINGNSTWTDTTISTISLSGEISARPTFDEVNKMIDDKMKKGNEEMKGFNFDFGPCTNDQVRMSMYGMAVKNAAGTYVSYNPKSKEIVDVDVLNFDGAKFMYKIPVAVKDIAVGDIIVHNRKPMFVVALPVEGSTAITCVDVCAGEQKLVIPTVNMFGFNFVTKIVSLFNTVGDNAPTPDAPFGNMLPFLMMGEGKDIDPMMMMCMMGGKMDMSNPMMMYFMLKDGNYSDMIPLMFMMQGK
jgi:hypothetical protein